ncbi:MAG: hypothetical protein CSYNP_01109 [Syntrophus sp. SKADARSKE-3]|nr:hypothetical protein [Syntrophus sp. SKADARSKE-3]
MKGKQKKDLTGAVQKKVTEGRSKKYLPHMIALLVIVLLTFVSFYPALKGEFTNWDDNIYIQDNPYIQSISANNVRAMFSEYYDGNYFPLTLLSLTIDYRLSGAQPRPYLFHLNNLILHLFNTVLVFWLVYLLIKRPDAAIVAAAFFGVHPLHVESVAWITERKDVLYTFFFLASLIGYVLYIRKNRTRFLFVSLILFVFSLLGKGQAVSLALSVILIDLLLGRKLMEMKTILEKLPFFVLSLIFGIIAINAQKQGEAIFIQNIFPIADRVAFACYGYVMYLFKLVIPVNLSAIYPYPANAGGSAPAVYWIYVLPVLVIFAAAIYLAKRSKPALFGILFFSANIVFVLQLLPVGNVVMADRYAYVPSIGVFFLAGFGYSEWVKKKAATKRFVQVAIIFSVLILSLLTNVRCAVWQNSLALWNDVTAKSPTAEVAWYNLGSAKNNMRDHSGALQDFNKAIELKKDYAEAYASRGMVKTNMKDYISAESDVSEAIRLKPDLAYSYYVRGVIRGLRNNFKGAVMDFDQAVALQKNYPAAYSERGAAKSQLGDLRGAMADFEIAISQDPNYANAYLYRGVARYTSGDRAGALVDFNMAIQLNPQQTQTYYLRGMVRFDLKQIQEACNDWRMGSSLGSHESAAAMEKFCGH